jgi:DNA-binding transcriptional MerR regulator
MATSTDERRRVTGDGVGLTIGEASEATGVSADTLRYYERVGILPPIRRVGGGSRRYGADDLGWVVFVRRLRATGMPVEKVVRYTDLAQQGDATASERWALLAEHRERVAAAIDELQVALASLDAKLASYEALERGVVLPCSTEPLLNVRQLG